MLAYVFSHAAGQEVDLATYEDVLRSFHEALASMPPRGFIRSLTYRVGGQAQERGYLDWYLLEDSSAMDALNEAAVTGGRAAAHQSVARMAAGGVGKLMSLAAGDHDDAAGMETRFAKPPGMSYEELYATLGRWTEKPGTALWRRMMVLGPPPEFCMESAGHIDLPADMLAGAISRVPI